MGTEQPTQQALWGAGGRGCLLVLLSRVPSAVRCHATRLRRGSPSGRHRGRAGSDGVASHEAGFRSRRFPAPACSGITLPLAVPRSSQRAVPATPGCDLCLSSPRRLEEDGETGALGARSGLARCVRGSRGTKRLVRLPIRIRHSRGGPRHSASGAPRASSAFTAPPCPPPQPGLCVLRPWCGASLWLLRPRSSLGVSLVLVTLSITFDQTSPPASNAVRAFSLHRAESQMK